MELLILLAVFDFQIRFLSNSAYWIFWLLCDIGNTDYLLAIAEVRSKTTRNNFLFTLIILFFSDIAILLLNHLLLVVKIFVSSTD